jgi:hypothetical protein
MKLGLAIGFLILASITADGASVTRGPYLQSAASDRMTVCWRTDVATSTQVSYATSVDGPFTAVTLGGTRSDHAVTLTGLQPATRYYYQIQGVPDSGAQVALTGTNYWFKTAPSPGEAAPTRIWVVGDSGYQFQGAVDVFNAYVAVTASAGQTTSAFLMLGDNAYANGTDSEIQSAVFNRYASLLRNTPVWSAFGNHDGYSTASPADVTPYDTSFRFPTSGECGGVASGSERYYSFNHGNIHFISLDTNTPVYANDAPGGTYGMVDWLRDDLRACTSDWIIVLMHQGPYSRGSHDSDVDYDLAQTRAYILPLLEDYGVDLVLCGHSHVYERSRLIDGHYGKSNTWNGASMLKWAGNGSDVGGIDSSGALISTLATGAYQKESAKARSGTLYAVVGSSSDVAKPWAGGSTAIVNPTPHPAHVANLRLLGSLVLEVEGLRLNGKYLDQTGNVRDDFTLLKGSTYQLLKPFPAFASETAPGIAFGIQRSGAVSFADDVLFNVTSVTGGGVAPMNGAASFAVTATEETASLVPDSGQGGVTFQMTLQPPMRSVQPGAALRAANRIAAPSSRVGRIESTPAATWYASRFGTLPPANVWATDTDGDGVSLLMEYATGGEPGQIDRVPFAESEDGGWFFRYYRATGRSDISYVPMVSTDMAVWQPAGALDVNDGATTLQGEPRKVSLPTPGHGFGRLKATLAP